MFPEVEGCRPPCQLLRRPSGVSRGPRHGTFDGEPLGRRKGVGGDLASHPRGDPNEISLPSVHLLAISHPSRWKLGYSRESLLRLGSWERPRPGAGARNGSRFAARCGPARRGTPNARPRREASRLLPPTRRGWAEAHEPLLAIAFRCAIEGYLYLLAC